MIKIKQFNGMPRLLVYVGVLLLSAAVAWGVFGQRVTANSKTLVEIKTVDLPKIDVDKLDKEVFQMYLDQRQVANEKSDAQRERIENKLDKALAK